MHVRTYFVTRKKAEGRKKKGRHSNSWSETTNRQTWQLHAAENETVLLLCTYTTCTCTYPITIILALLSNVRTE